MQFNAPGEEMYGLATRYFPICRSITGNGVRESLALLQKELGSAITLNIHEVPSGSHCFDWIVPDEWNIKDAYIADEAGNKVVDFQKNNLHVVYYSEPVNLELSLEELQPHLFSLPNMPTAIPYITSFYKRFWGFCLSQEQRDALKPGRYKVVIDSTLEPGSLTYADILLPGKSKKEIVVSTYVCHPSMGNNETSGPVLVTYLAKWIASLADREHSFRFIFVPETIGAIVYLSKNLEEMKRNVVAGLQASCVGDNRAYSYLPSRLGNTVADKAAQHVLKHHAPDFVRYTFLKRGSDERQYCSPGVNLPFCSILRTRYGDYPEYHTSLDDLNLISADGLGGAWNVYARCLLLLDKNKRYRTTTPCEPQLGRRGLYQSLGTTDPHLRERALANILAYADGDHDVIDIAEICGVDALELLPLIDLLLHHNLLEAV
jgi:aminopeptidase-like protein